LLKSLHISNYALIQAIDIDFDPGFNIITGETGAGKSIMLGALGLVMGNRADLSVIRDAGRKTIVEAEFDISSLPEVSRLLADNDIDSTGMDYNTCVLRREITARGGSRAFVNDSPVTLTLLRQVAMQLIDIHSQHQNLLLATQQYQMHIIDTLAGNDDLLAEYSDAYAEYRQALKKYTATRDMLTRSRADAEYLTYQLQQIEQLDLRPDEQKQLEHDREIMANATDIKQHLTSAIDFIDGTQGNVSASLARAREELQHLDDVYDDVDSLVARLESARIEIADIAGTLSDMNRNITASPDDLQSIEDRLGSIYSLLTRHHLDTSDQLLALRDSLRSQLDTINNGDNCLHALEAEARNAKKKAVLIARKLTAARAAAAADFEVSLKQHCAPLGMDNLNFKVSMQPVKLSPTGADDIEFLFAFNKNQELTTVGKTASGGEISRVILAIKAIVAHRMAMPTIVFDEVDTGVSGDIANRMAREMESIAHTTQVVTITHLPQVAARGVRHFKVYKRDDDVSTTTFIDVLDRDARCAELALMISGDASDVTALATAHQLLSLNN